MQIDEVTRRVNCRPQIRRSQKSLFGNDKLSENLKIFTTLSRVPDSLLRSTVVVGTVIPKVARRFEEF